MSKVNKEQILNASALIFAEKGGNRFSIRLVAKTLSIAPSLIYYYFESEDELLLQMFGHLNRQLGLKRSHLPKCSSARQMLKQRIAFQIDEQASIVSVLKYYVRFRHTFQKLNDGFLPDKSSLHIEEVLLYGVSTNEFKVDDVSTDAKFITHAINGYLLEFFPYSLQPKEKERLVEVLSERILKVIT